MTLCELSAHEVRQMQCCHQVLNKPGKRRHTLIEMCVAAKAHELGRVVKRRSPDPRAKVFHDCTLADAVTTLNNHELEV